MSIKKVFTFLGWPILFLPIALLWLGIACNNLATNVNGNHMPVMNGICETQSEKIASDYIHVCATSHTHLKILVDRFPNNEGVLSAGDILQVESAELQQPCLLLWLLTATCALIGIARKKK